MEGDSRWHLQERIAGLQDWIAATPGACNSGRALGCDDVDRFGWGRIDAVMVRDGVLTFRMLPAARAPELIAWGTRRGYRVDFWDTFLGARAEVLQAADAIQDRSLPPGLQPGPIPIDPDAQIIEDIQALMTQCGVTPYAASMLAGRVEPARTVTILDSQERVVAAGFGHLPHRAHSRFRDHAYGGAIAVRADQRGRGLGRCVNAMLATRVLRELAGEYFYEFASADNAQSRRMVESCGLRLAPGLLGAIAVAGTTRFTR